MGNERLRAILLIGPTGSGKTPLGECFERGGWRGDRCAHFDFGAQLRRVASGESVPDRLSAADHAFIGEVLQAGALLEDEQFHIAEKILRSFTEQREIGNDGYLLLNGLPRHAGQAAAVDRVAVVELVIHLRCTPEVVRRRIQTDAGGDRAGRVDDGDRLVARKLDIFRERTAPLLDHYRLLGVPFEAVEVTEETEPEQIWSRCNPE
jgi:adenylate kinase